MKQYNTAFIGRHNSLKRALRNLNKSGSALSAALLPVAATTLDASGKPQDIPFPVYADWKIMLENHAIQIIHLLDADEEIKKQLRRDLPLDIELIEHLPGQLLHASFLSQKAFLRKAETREKFLIRLVESLPIPAIIFDKKGQVLFWNEACSNLTQVPAEEVLGRKHVGKAFYSYERPMLGQIIIDTLDYKDVLPYYDQPEIEIHPISLGFQVVGYLYLKLDIQGYYQLIAQRIVSGEEIIGSVQLIQDVSSLHILEEQLNKQRDQLKEIISHLPYPLIHSNQNGTILYTNTAAQNTTFLKEMTSQKKRGEGQNIFTLIPEIKTIFEPFLNQEVAETHPGTSPNLSKELNVHIQGEDWEVICLALAEENKSWTLIWILNNLSLKEDQERLNAAVAIAGAISHELSQPLTAIINSAQLLARTDLENKERLKRQLDIIVKEGERVLSLYNKLQNITKYRVTDYLGMQILDLDESSHLLDLDINDTTKE